MPYNDFGTGSQTLSNAGVQALLKEMRENPRKTNPPVLGIHMRAVMQGKNNGFPVDMYHLTLDPVSVKNEEEAVALEARGYSRHYTPREFPCFFHRRNTDPKFAATFDKAGMQLTHDFIESIQVRSVEHFEELKRTKRRPTQGEWRRSIADVDKFDPLPEEGNEDPKMTIAKLEAALNEARRASDNDAKQKAK